MATTTFAPLVRAGGVTLAVALSAASAMAQAPGAAPRRPAPPAPVSQSVTTQALPRDLIAEHQPAQSFIESYTAEHPCVYHTHNHTAYVKLRRVLATPLPSGTKATLYKEGQLWHTWNTVTQTGANNQPIVLGTFTWTTPHPCPDGTASVSPPPPSYGYRLVIDPGNQVAESSEQNNSVDFRINQIAAFAKVP
ncbi:MAG: hypothetical protein ABI037_01100 [Gemmatimonadales bacterium]